MGRNEKILESFKKGFEVIQKKNFIQLKEDKVIKVKIKNEEKEILLEKGTVIFDADDNTTSKWVHLMFLLDEEYEKENIELIGMIDNYLN